MPENHQPTILVVDDERLVVQMMEITLAKSGFRVISAISGFEALDAFRTAQQDIDLVVTDIVMPGMEGTLLAERLQSLKPELPVLFISGYTDRLMGIHGPFLQKPFTSAALVQKISTLLNVA